MKNLIAIAAGALLLAGLEGCTTNGCCDPCCAPAKCCAPCPSCKGCASCKSCCEPCHPCCNGNSCRGNSCKGK